MFLIGSSSLYGSKHEILTHSMHCALLKAELSMEVEDILHVWLPGGPGWSMYTVHIVCE